MSVELATTVWAVIGIYLGVGIMVALVFVTLLIKRASEGARTAAPLQMRLIILPACIVLWPIVGARSFFPAKTGGDHEASS